jgi:pimeloyl-ACP methyl ester carboxylesterase
MGLELQQDAESHGLTEENIIHIPGLLSRWVKLADGSRAHYVTSGETGPAVILLHGGIQGSSGTAGWRFMAPYLGAHGFRVYAPDQPAYGLSDSRPEYYPTRGYQSYVNYIDMLADALCLEKFHIGGNSFGTHNVMEYVVNHPERVLSYAMIAAGSPPSLVDPALRVLGKDGKFTPNPNYVSPGWDGTEESMRILMEGIIYKPAAIWPELITMRNSAGLLQKESTAARMKANQELANDVNYQQWADLRQRLPKVTIPGIYLYGKNDVLGPVENGWNQEDVLPNVQFFYPDQCGHQGQTDQPEMFNEVFLEFFRDGKVSRKTADWAGVSDRRPENPNLVAQS